MEAAALRGLGFDEKKRNARAEIKAPTIAEAETSARSRELFMEASKSIIKDIFYCAELNLLCSLLSTEKM